MKILGMFIAAILGFLWGTWLTQASQNDFVDKSSHKKK